jgi:HSP20 family protein
MTAAFDPQHVPVKMFQSADGDRLTVAAPMPGLEPQDITVEVTQKGGLMLHAEPRGVLKDENAVLVDEWNPGPYHREVKLSVAVNAEMGNVTYNNGVVVVVLPVDDVVHPARLELHQVSAERGQRVGNTGHPINATTTQEHWQSQAASAASAARTGDSGSTGR